LSAGGAKGQCGWLKDKFGVSWQIVPVQVMNLLAKKEAAPAGA
jgi:predicted 3-demethylubiquinone-9 3-methyltransferase (glyoxalase superfamily)